MTFKIRSAGCIALLCLSITAQAAPRVLDSRDSTDSARPVPAPLAPRPAAPPRQDDAKPATPPPASAPGSAAADLGYGLDPTMIGRILASDYGAPEKDVAVNCAINHYRFWWSARQIENDPPEQRERLFCNRINEGYKREVIFADCQKFQALFDWDVLGDASEFFQVSTSCDRGHYVEPDSAVPLWSCRAFTEETGDLARLIEAKAIGGKEICAVSRALNARKLASCGALAGAELEHYQKQTALARELEAAYCAP